MRILIVGAAGTFGRAIHQRLQERGHDIITVGRKTGDIRCDIADEQQLTRLWEQAGQVDAVVSAAGEVKYAPLDQLSSGDFLESFTQKGLAQINLVRTGLDHVTSTRIIHPHQRHSPHETQ
jgi:NADP-dependent 3-hydroxy acid dehydrogenase YdfG